MTDRATRLHSPMIVYFDAIRRAGSVRGAARTLNVASSAVNRHLLKLEEELGTPLFERLPGGLKLTHAGATFARHAIGVIQDAERVRSELEALQGLRSGHVEIAAIEGLATHLIPEVIWRARERFPRITLGVAIMGSQGIPTEIANGNADLGLAFNLARSRELHQIASWGFHLGAIVSPDHPLAALHEIGVASCLSHKLILPKSELSIYQAIQRSVSEPPTGVVESNSVELAKQLAIRGIGVAFQTRIGMEAELASGDLLHLPIKRPAPLLMQLGMYVRASRSPPVAVHAVAQLFEDEISRQQTSDDLPS